MHEKVLDAFVTKGDDQCLVLEGKDTYIGPVQSVRLESQGPEQPSPPDAVQISGAPITDGAPTFITPYPMDRSRLRAIITDDTTDWIMPTNQVLLRYGKKVLEQPGTPGKHWHNVTNGKGLRCLWSDLAIGDVIRVGTSQTDGYTDFMTITDIKDVDEIHNGTDSPIPMFTAECIYALYGDKPNLANYGLTTVESIDNNGHVYMQGNGSVQNNWDYHNWSQTWVIPGTSDENSHDTYDDVTYGTFAGGSANTTLLGSSSWQSGYLLKMTLPQQQFWLNTRTNMHETAETYVAGLTDGPGVVTDSMLHYRYQQALRDQNVKSYITRERFDNDLMNQLSSIDFAQTNGLPGSTQMGWDAVRIGKDTRRTVTRATDDKLVISGRGLPADSPAFKCFRVSAFVNCTSLGNIPSPTTYTSTVRSVLPATIGQTGDVTLSASHPLYPKSNAFMPSNSAQTAVLEERYTTHLYRDSVVQGQWPTTVDPLNRWQKYLYPLFKASSFIDKEAQLKLTLKSDVKAVTKITLVGFNLLNQSMGGFQMQHKHGYQATDFVVLRIKEIEGGVVSNNPCIQGAFAVLPNNSPKSFDDGSYESCMYEPERGVASLCLAEGQRGVRFLTFELKDQFGNDVAMTGRVQLWLRLHCLCG